VIVNITSVSRAVCFLKACLKKERGCVEDQPQHGAGSRLIWKFGTGCGWSGDDTAALRFFQTGSKVYN